MYLVRCAGGRLAVRSLRVAAIQAAHLLANSLNLRHSRLAMVLECITRTKGIRAQRGGPDSDELTFV